jgi:hypothetical protein
MPQVLMNFIRHLPPRWVTNVLHGRENGYVRASSKLQPSISAGSLKFMLIDDMGLGVSHADYKNGREWYNRMLARSAFWTVFSSPLLLLFEMDSALCSSPTRPLQSFSGAAGYAFIGAPWSAYKDGFFPHQCRNLGSCVGNSGLSLWRRDIMQRVTALPFETQQDSIALYLKTHRGSAIKPGKGADQAWFDRMRRGQLNQTNYFEHLHIDNWMSLLLQSLEAEGKLGATAAVPSQTIASRFSVETLYSSKAPWVPFGTHKPYRYLSSEQLQQLFKACPEAQALADAVSSDTVTGEPPARHGQRLGTIVRAMPIGNATR